MDNEEMSPFIRDGAVAVLIETEAILRRNQKDLDNLAAADTLKQLIRRELKIDRTEPAQQLQAAIIRWGRSHELWYDALFYSPEQWHARREACGVNAVFTLVAEGPLNHALNGYLTPELACEFYELAEEHGFWVGQGLSWSWHFYPVGDEDQDET